jgi:hypothetical protein
MSFHKTFFETSRFQCTYKFLSRFPVSGYSGMALSATTMAKGELLCSRLYWSAI